MRFIFLFLTFLLFSLPIYANNEPATKDDIKIVLEQMDKRFAQIDKRFEQVDKHFDQMDKRFEQIDKRLDFMQNLIYALMGLVFASPFIAIYLRDKKEAEERKVVDNIKGVMFVLREMAQNDEKISKSLKAAGLL
jgi:archaellum component FlaC